MDSLTPMYRPVRVASFPAMDDPDRNLLILYKLEDTTETTPQHLRRRPIPGRLVTRLGEQPSVTQLQH